MKVVYASAIKEASGTNSATRRIATFARKLLVRRLFLKFTTKPIRHYPPHLTHVPTQPWEIKNQIFCRYSADMEESANKSSAVAEMGDRLATIDMDRRAGRGCCGGWVPTGSPSNTMWPGPRPTSLPSGILIHPTDWPQFKLRNATYAPPRRNTLTDYFYP